MNICGVNLCEYNQNRKCLDIKQILKNCMLCKILEANPEDIFKDFKKNNL